MEGSPRYGIRIFLFNNKAMAKGVARLFVVLVTYVLKSHILYVEKNRNLSYNLSTKMAEATASALAWFKERTQI